MRIGDNNLSFYGVGHQAPAVAKPVAAESPQKLQTPPVNESQKQQLLQRYLQAESVGGGVSSLNYSQQRAVASYSLQARHDEFQKLQAVMGIDEYA